MSNENKMSPVVIALLGFVVVIILIAASIIGLYVSNANTGAKFEANIETLNSDSENVLSSVTTNIKNQAGIVGVYSKDFQDSLVKSMSGRYGSDGSRATIQMIKEQNPNLDSSLYAKVQSIIDGGAKEFRISQTRKLEVCRDYKARLNYVVSGAFMRMAGYPKSNLAIECRVVSDADSHEAFATGLQKPIDFKRQ